MKRLAIIGAGELGRQILHLATQSDEYSVIGFFDDYQSIGEKIDGIEILGSLNDIDKLHKKKQFEYLIIGIGYNHMTFRKEIFEKYASYIPFATIVHQSCIIDKTAKIGKGVVLYPGCNIDKDVTIKDNCLLNLSTIVAHNSKIGAHSFLAPGVIISGFVIIGKCSFIGSGSIIIDNKSICDKTTLGAGSVVIKNIESIGIYVGNPAFKLK